MQLLILISVSLDVALMLLHSPHIHLQEAGNGEQQSYKSTLIAFPTRQRVCGDSEEHPGEHLRTIVGTGHELKERALRNGALLRAVALSHAAELQVNGSVDALTDKHARETEIKKTLGGHGGVERVAESVADLWVTTRKSAYK